MSCSPAGYEKDDKILAPVITLNFKPEDAMEAIRKPAALWN